MKFLLGGSIILLLSACANEPDCLITATNQVKISLKKTTSAEAQSVQFISISISGTDSTFYKNKTASSLVLYVDPRDVKTTLRFKYLDALKNIKKDSLVLSYVHLNVVISPECGGFVYYNSLSVYATSFTSEPKIVNNQLSTSVPVNLEIKL